MPVPDLPSWLARKIGADEIEAYRRDGAAVIRNVVPDGWIERMRTAIDRILGHPGDAAIEYTPEGKPGRYYGDFFMWRRDEDFRAFMMASPMPELAAVLMESKELHFLYDQLLVKEPKTAEQTPWHHDLPYWPVRGEDIISIWVPFDPATPESGVVQYIRGSHKWGKMYQPATFGKKTGFEDQYAAMGLEPMPDIAGHIEDYDVITWNVEPGDVIVHHTLTLHYSAGNASTTGRRRGLALRYTGDDAVFDARPGTLVHNPKVKAILPPITLKDGDPFSDDPFPKVWPRG